MINIAICDDDKTMLNTITRIAQKEFADDDIKCVIKPFSSGVALLNSHKKEAFNILFLDICMPSIDGFSVAKQAKELNKDVFIIFITSNDELVYESFMYQPFYFIKKDSINGLTHDVSSVIKKLIAHVRQYDSILLEISPGRKAAVLYKNILYVKSDKHYLDFYLIDKKLIHQRGNIADIEISLADYDFIKVHKRNLINMNYIKYIDNRMLEIVLKDGTKLEMSRNYKKETEEK